MDRMPLKADRKATFLAELSRHGITMRAARAASPHSATRCLSTFTRLQYGNALLRRAEELADKQGVTPNQALSANLTTDSTIRELSNAYEVANAAEYGSTVRKLYAGAGA